jgi:hypothetical protein
MASLLTCPACGFLTLREPYYGSFDICRVCKWEDCDLQLNKPRHHGGPNGESLFEAQVRVVAELPLTITEHGGYARDPAWRPLDEAESALLRRDGNALCGKSWGDPADVYWKRRR